MKTSLLFACVCAFGIGLSFASPAVASPGAKGYQVTGPVVAIDDAKIVVKKGNDTWEINRKADTKMEGAGADQIKPGDKVTVHYTMDASSVEVKADKADKPAKEKAPAAKAKKK